jgi:MerR family transcriptional regulator, thiopeptide resistance regulator
MDVGEMFDGFDHTTYKDEVVERWGADAYAASDAWWRTLGEQGQTAWRRESADLAQAWVALAATGADPSGPAAQELAARHVVWVSRIPGTPGSADDPDLDYVTGLGELYVADPRFSRTYGGQAGAELVRDALTAWAVAR